MPTRIHCCRPSDIPKEPHYAIIKSVYIPGDERSRTHPGHGYPASTEYYLDYTAFTDREEWEAEVNKLASERSTYTTPFLAVQVTPALVETSVKVTITPAQKVYTQRCPKCGQRAQSIRRDGFSTRECLCGHTWKPEEDLQL